MTAKDIKINGVTIGGSRVNGIINFFKMQPKIIGGFRGDEQRGGGDKAAKPVYLNGVASFIRYRMDEKIVLFIWENSPVLWCDSKYQFG